MKNKLKKALYFSAGLATLSVAGLIVSSQTSMNAYAGGGGATSGSTGCGICGNAMWSSCVCDSGGFSWVWYERFGSGAISFVGNSTSGLTVIKGCSSGFMHLGYDIYESDEPGNPGSSWFYVSARGGSFKYNGHGGRGQVGSRSTNYTSGSGGSIHDVPTGKIKGFKFKDTGGDGGTAIDAYGASTAKSKYNDAIKNYPDEMVKYNASGTRIGMLSKNDYNSLSWFCYPTNKKATFTATTSKNSGSDGSTTSTPQNVTKDTVTLKWDHKVTRNGGDGGEFKIKNKLETKPRKTSSNTSPAAPNSTTKNWESKKIGDNTTINDTLPINVIPGTTYKYCSKLSYYSIKNTDKTSDDKQSTTNEVCLSVYRVNRQVAFSANTKVYADTGNGTAVTERDNPKGNNNVVTTTDGKFTVKFVHTITRGNVLGPAGYTNDDNFKVDASYKTYVRDTGNYYSVNKKSTVKEGTWRSMKKNQSNQIIDEFKGTIHPKQEVTFCQRLHYQTKNDEKNTALNTGKDSSRDYTQEKCVTIKRAEAVCGGDFNYADYKYGYNKGWNVGYISVNNATMGVTKTSPHAPADYNNSGVTKNAPDLYARPGDLIQYTYKFCAGAQYPNYLNKATHVTTYRASGTTTNPNANTNDKKNQYLFDSQVTRYNVSGQNTTTFHSPRTWTSTANSVDQYVTGSKKFPYDKFDATFTSPQNPNTIYKNYNCAISSGPSNPNNFYQVSGRIKGQTGSSNSPDTSTNCATGLLDVGTTISQTVTWTDRKIKAIDNHGVDDNRISTNQIDSIHNGSKNNGAKASVKVPYNYKLAPHAERRGGSSARDGKVVYRGTTLNVDTGVTVMRRTNTNVSTDNTKNEYATITKPTHIKTRWYVETPGGAKKCKTAGGYYGCSAYYGAGSEKEEVWILNRTGRLNGTAGDKNHDGDNENKTIKSIEDGRVWDTITIDIPDELDLGDRVCGEVSVSPFDSHDGDNSASSIAAIALSSSSNYPIWDSRNTLTVRACYTVSKLPTMSVEGSNAYSGSGNGKGFITSRFYKQFGSTKYMFGSWSEYGLYGLVDNDGIHGTASGATFGYETGTSGVVRNQNRANSGNVAKTSNTTTCTYATQTFINSNCNTATDVIGKAGMGKTSARDFRNRILDRFTSGNASAVQKNEYENNCTRDDAGRWVSSYYQSGYAMYSNIKCVEAKDSTTGSSYTKYAFMPAWINHDWDENGINHLKINGNAYWGDGVKRIGGGANNNKLNVYYKANFDNGQFNATSVHEVSGTYVLDGDVLIGDGEGNNFIDDPTYTNLGQSVMRVFVADKIYLTNKVERVDAILIANEINTCAYNTYEDFMAGKKAVIGGESGSVMLNSTMCNNHVQFNAPVMAKKIVLNRTGGSEKAANTAVRAETFDMNMNTYFWSYIQMSRYSQAVTTYSRELPTRY